MLWIAPPQNDAANGALEQRLWAAADQLRANSGLTSQQYSQPVLGLIFLRFADARFNAVRNKLENQPKGGRRGSRLDDPKAYNAEGVVYLPPEARYSHLLGLPEGSGVGKKLNEAMRAIERDNSTLTEVLPKTYQIFDGKLLKDLLKKVSEIPAELDYDAFGRIYEYFLGEFARTEGSKGGEFYTPASIVRLMVEILEPFHGKILDPACGSGGMFVQSAQFVAEHRKNPAAELSIHGQERVGETARLCRMNLAVHGLEGEIKEANSYYEDEHRSTGAFDFLLANPPFNVNAVDKERLVKEVGEGKRYPFGLPRADNANYLWIQLFYSALNKKGRAGFVMANSASDARGSEQEIRRQLIEARAVDVIVAVGPNMFYTVTLPCTLWFLDRGKRGTSRDDKVLFLDARHVHRQVDRAHRDWTPGQIGFLANVVRLYRGEEPDYTLGGDEAREKVQEVFGKKVKYRDVPGLCRAATAQEIENRTWSLNPGGHVGVAPGEDLEDGKFLEKLEFLNEEMQVLTKQALAPGDVPLVKGENVSQGRILWDISKRWPAGEWKHHEKFHLRSGDVVVAMDRPWVPAGLKWAVVREGDPPALLVQRVARLRAKKEILHQSYLPVVIGSPAFEGYVRPITTGVNVPHISGQQISDFQFPLPPLELQDEIARILGAYDDLIENNLHRIRRLEEIARAIYREWFVHYRFPEHEGITLMDSPLGRAPTGWAVRFGDLVTIERDGLNPGDFVEETFEHYSIPAYDEGQLPVLELGEAVRSNKYVITDQCILLSKLNPRISRVWLVRPLGEHRAIASTEFLVMKPRRDEFRALVYASCLDETFQGRFVGLAVGTSTSHQRV